MRCFLCDEEGYFAYRCPARTLLQRLLKQQPQEQTRRPPQGPILGLPAANDRSSASPVHLNLTGGSPEAKVAPVKCGCSTAHLRPALHRGHTSFGAGRHRGLCYMPWFCAMVALPRPMGGTPAFQKPSLWCTWETSKYSR